MGTSSNSPNPLENQQIVADQPNHARAKFLADPKHQFILGLVTTILVCVLFVLGGKLLGQIPKLSRSGWYAICGACAALILKMLISNQIGQDFKFHKHGYDMCVMAFGTSLTTLSYEMSHPKVDGPTITFVFVLFVMVFCAMLQTGLNTVKIDAEKAGTKHTGSIWTNIILGVFAILFNIMFLVVKDIDSQQSAVQQPSTSAPAPKVSAPEVSK